MGGVLSHTVRLKDLLDNLRCGLSALVPVVERAGIPWTESESYDDWDAIASALYEQFVVNTVCEALELDDNLTFPKYDLVYPSYESLAYFELFSQPSAVTFGPFIGFEAKKDSGFCNVKYAIKENRDDFDTTKTGTALFAECGVRLRLRDRIGDGLEELRMPHDDG